MGDKVKNLPRREMNPPNKLAFTEPFAFVSPFPLDFCIRQLLDKNQRSYWGALFGQSQIDVDVVHAGMNDQYFALTSRRSRGVSGWALGAISDVDGDSTMLEGVVGVARGEILFSLAITTLMFLFLVWLGSPRLAAAGSAAFAAVEWVHIRYAKSEVRRLLRNAFYMPGDDSRLPMMNDGEGPDGGR